MITDFIDLFLHLDQHLGTLLQTYGTWTYLLLFGVIFLETGLVVTPFLPGDSLLFAAGAFAGLGLLQFQWLLISLIIAAILGDTVNFWIGHYVGERAYQWDSRFVKREHLERTQGFYERHGGKAIVLARFVPIVRTFAPFVAGIGQMEYRRFILFNVGGGALWVTLMLGAGLLFGNLEVVRENFSLAVLAVIAISLMPMVVEAVKSRRQKADQPAPP